MLKIFLIYAQLQQFPEGHTRAWELPQHSNALATLLPLAQPSMVGPGGVAQSSIYQ